MSVDKTPQKPAADVIKDAEVVSTPSQPTDSMPTAKPITFGQQIFIWSMILVVGVLFGVGSSWTFLQQPVRSIGGVSENDILVRKNVADRLQAILGESGDYFVARTYEDYASNLRLARFADSQGLMPEGVDLKRVVNEFLDRTLPNSTRTFRDLLSEHQGGKDQVTRPQLEQYLAERAAIDGLFARRLAAPAVSLTVADQLDQLRRTRISGDEVILSAEHLMPIVAAEDPEIQTTYEKLRSTRFTRKAQVTATLAAADFAALTAKAVVGEAEIKAWYESHKETYRKPAAADAKPEAPAEYRTLEEVMPEIKATLAREQAEKAAQAAVTAFNSVIEDKDLELADNVAFTSAATAAGLVVVPAMTIDEPSSGQVTLGAFGTIKDPAGIFAKEPGFITNPLQAAGTDKTWFVLRVDAKSPAGFRALDEVKPEVQRIVAGNRAYKALLEQAEALRAAADKAGPGGLKQLMADPAQAAWKANVTNVQLSPLQELKAPATEIGGAPGESTLVASLTLPARPVVLVLLEGETVVPSVRLVQVREVSSDAEAPAGPRDRAASAYREALTGYRRTQFDRELRDQLGN